MIITYILYFFCIHFCFDLCGKTIFQIAPWSVDLKINSNNSPVIVYYLDFKNLRLSFISFNENSINHNILPCGLN